MFKKKWYRKNKELEIILLNDSHLIDCKKVLNDIRNAFPYQFAALENQRKLYHSTIQSWIKSGMSPQALGDKIYEYMTELRGHHLGFQEEWINEFKVTLPVRVPSFYRERHQIIVGSTGSGKTNDILYQIYYDLLANNGYTVFAVDPDIALLCLDMVMRYKSERINDVIYINPLDTEKPVPLNPFWLKDNIELRKEQIFSVFTNLMQTTEIMELPLKYIIATLLNYEVALPYDIKILLNEKNPKRNQIINSINDSETRDYWYKEFRIVKPITIQALLNRVDFFFHGAIRNLCCQLGCIDIRKIMDDKKIVIVNLSEGLIGENASEILGKILFCMYQLAFLSRADISERIPHILYVDEFQNFVVSKAIDKLLTRSRKYAIWLVLACQHFGQLPEKIISDLLHNVKIIQVYETGSPEAKKLCWSFLTKSEEGERINRDYMDFIDLDVGNSICKIGKVSFLKKTKKYPISEPNKDYIAQIVECSRNNYGIAAQKIKELIKIDETMLNDPFYQRKPFVQITTN